MDSSSSSSPTKPQIAHDISPYLIEYSDGTIKREGTERVPPGFDPQTGVTSKDILILPETGVSARIYRPAIPTNKKLPLVVYFHGGAFVIASPALPIYHTFCNSLVALTGAVLVSVDYRRAPEHPLPAAFDDAWAAFQWVAAHTSGCGGPQEEWLREGVVDYSRVFLAGDSAGATLAHHVASLVGRSGLDKPVGIEGVVMIHPYIWGKDPIGPESEDPRREMVNRWWLYVCPSDKGCDDPLINPFADGAPGVDGVVCGRMLVLVAGDDVLKLRGKLYYDAMLKKRGEGTVEFYETQGKEHVFHIFDRGCREAVELRNKVASFINQRTD